MRINQRRMGAALTYVYVFANILIVLFYTPIMLDKLNQAEYGLYSLAGSFIGYLTVLDLGFGNAIVVYTSKYRALGRFDDEKKLHGMFFAIFTLIGAAAVVIGLILSSNMSFFFGKTLSPEQLDHGRTIMLIMTVNMAFTFPLSIFENIIMAYERFVFQKIIAIVRIILNPLIMLPLLYMGGKAITMSIVLVCVNIACLCANMLYCTKKLNIKIRFSRFDRKLFTDIFSYSIFIFIASIVGKINWSSGQFIIGAIRGTKEVAVYAEAMQFNSLVMNLSGAFSAVMLPKMASLVAVGATDEEISDEFIKVGRVQYLILFLASTGFIFFGREFIFWQAGPEYEGSYYVALILILSIMFPLTQNMGINIVQAKNLFRFRAIATLIMAVVCIIISIPLTDRFGSIGCAIGTAVSLIAVNLIVMNIYYRYRAGIDIKRFWLEIFHMTAPLAMPIGAMYFIMKFFPLYGMIKVVVYGALYVVMYSACAYLMSLNDYERGVIKHTLIKFKLMKPRNVDTKD